MKWYTKYLQVYEKPFSEAPQEIVEEVRNKLKLLQSDNPLVTVSLIGYNEEKHLLASLWSLESLSVPIISIGYFHFISLRDHKLACRCFSSLYPIREAFF